MSPNVATPRVSVALCVHNGAPYLATQMESLLAQEGVDLEIVAVDDHSTDDSLLILRAYAGRDPRIRVYENATNLGHLRSFERCMALCTSELIAPCDQDDLWHPRKLVILAHAIGDADMAYCDSAYIDAEGRPLGRRISDDLKVMHAGIDPLKYVFQNTVSGHALLVRRKVFDAALPFPALLYHDWWLAIRAAAGDGVVYVDQPLVQFRRHTTAFSPLGKKTLQTRRERKVAHAGVEMPSKIDPKSSDRRWVEERLYLMNALGTTDWRGSEEARAWKDVLHAAIAGDSRGVLGMAWRTRHSIPPFKGPTWWNVFQFAKRVKRKVRRARVQRPVQGALFRL
jgi:glycosyltransferase involved in cell wall biosynthesis